MISDDTKVAKQILDGKGYASLSPLNKSIVVSQFIDGMVSGDDDFQAYLKSLPDDGARQRETQKAYDTFQKSYAPELTVTVDPGVKNPYYDAAKPNAAPERLNVVTRPLQSPQTEQAIAALHDKVSAAKDGFIDRPFNDLSDDELKSLDPIVALSKDKNLSDALRTEASARVLGTNDIYDARQYSYDAGQSFSDNLAALNRGLFVEPILNISSGIQGLMHSAMQQKADVGYVSDYGNDGNVFSLGYDPKMVELAHGGSSDSGNFEVAAQNTGNIAGMLAGAVTAAGAVSDAVKAYQGGSSVLNLLKASPLAQAALGNLPVSVAYNTSFLANKLASDGTIDRDSAAYTGITLAEDAAWTLGLAAAGGVAGMTVKGLGTIGRKLGGWGNALKTPETTKAIQQVSNGSNKSSVRVLVDTDGKTANDRNMDLMRKSMGQVRTEEVAKAQAKEDAANAAWDAKNGTPPAVPEAGQVQAGTPATVATTATEPTKAGATTMIIRSSADRIQQMMQDRSKLAQWLIGERDAGRKLSAEQYSSVNNLLAKESEELKNAIQGIPSVDDIGYQVSGKSKEEVMSAIDAISPTVTDDQYVALRRMCDDIFSTEPVKSPIVSKQ